MNQIKYFCDGNTARGYKKIIEGNLRGINNIIGLQSLSFKKVNEVLQLLLLEFNGEETELIFRVDNPEWLGGLLIPKRKLAIVDNRLFENKSNLVEFTLEDKLDEVRLVEYEDEKKKYDHYRNNAYESYDKALKIHDEWERIYIESMDFERANEYTDLVIKNLNLIPKGRTGKEKHRFLGGATHKGAVDFVMNITENIPQRIFIKGRPGSGKSTLLKKLVKASIECGYDVEVYHCGFDPNSLDMVIIRELGFATFDSTAPHEYFPVRDGDSISDHYEIFVHDGTDEKYLEEINEIKERYTVAMQVGREYLEGAKLHFDKMEDLIYTNLSPKLMEDLLKTIR